MEKKLLLEQTNQKNPIKIWEAPQDFITASGKQLL